MVSSMWFGRRTPEKIYTVTEITREIKRTLEQGFPSVWVEGEISNYLLHSSGHRYFTLKDEGSQIRCTLWRFRGPQLRFEPEDGVKVMAWGDVTVYEKNGQYQLDVSELVPAGMGRLEMAFRQLKERLFQEGLFDEEHKKPIPRFPETIGVVTSTTGAAIRDMVRIVHDRFPAVGILVRPAKVQGDRAAEDIAQAIRDLNEYKQVDVMIVGRGGGSLEDLWAFNEEVVARAIYHSQIPVISAVGHEIDFTISDFVADLRAPTPSAAAQMVVEDREDLLGQVRLGMGKLASSLSAITHVLRQRLTGVEESYGFRRPLDIITQRSQKVDEVSRLLMIGEENLLRKNQNRLYLFGEKLKALSPSAILKRGYCVARKLPEMMVLTDARAVKTEDRIELRLHKGRIKSRVELIHAD
jgi:exodeoxyribonuclease VII large subunit